MGTCSVQELVTNLNRERELHDNRGKKAGKFVVQRAEQQQKVRPAAVEVVFTAKGLPAMDGLMGKVDPFLQVLAFPHNRHSADPFLAAMTKYQKKTYTPTWEPIALTEHICGGYEAPLVLRVFDYDADGTHDFVGEARTTLREIVSAAPRFTLINPGLKGKGGYKNSGIVEVARHAAVPPTADVVPQSITVQMKGHKLSNKDIGGKSDPYLKIVHDSRTVHKTETRKNDLEPVWSNFTLNVSECGGMDHPLSWEVFDHDHNTKDDLIGKATFSLRRLSFFDKNPVIRLVDQKRVGSLGYKNSGFLVISSVTLNNGPGPVQGHVPQGGMPPQQGYPQQGGYPPQQGGYPPQGGNPYGGYPPQQQGGYPPQGGYAPQQQGGYPPQGGYAYGGYPPQQQGGYPPQGGNPYGGH